MYWPTLLVHVLLATATVTTVAAPLVIAHRGASGHRPDHTLESYRLAIEMGADFIEPDLVATRDGHLVARHEPEISETTDVAKRPEFADRRRTLVIDGIETAGWFTIDFTLEELRTLRARQPRADRSKAYDGLYTVPTLEEIIQLAQRESKARGRAVGIYPETKHPSWHCAMGLALEPKLLDILAASGWNQRDAPVYVQSFEAGNLKWLRQRTSLKLVQLIGAAGLDEHGAALAAPPVEQSGCTLYPVGELPRDFTQPEAFRQIAEYADGVGPWKRWIVGAKPTSEATQSPLESARHAAQPTEFVALAHAAELVVHPWTFRDEPMHLLIDYGGDPAAEYRQFATLGVDAVFSDFPDTALRALGR